MSDYAELVKRLRHADEYEPLGSDGWEAADAIEALIRERDNVLAEMDAFAKGMAEGAYARGYRDGLEKAAEECDRLWKAAARAIRALIPE